MAKEPEKKPRWYQLIAQAYRVTAPNDKWLLPLLIVAFVVPVAAAVAVGLVIGSTIAIVYAAIFGLLAGVLAAMFMLTRRFEKNAFARMENQTGGSIAIAQSIRSSWTFEENPVSVDPRGKYVVFQGIGRGGVVLLAEGGNAAKKAVDTYSRRIGKLVPGVPVRHIYVGRGEGQVPIPRLTKEIKRGKKVLSRRERDAVAARLNAIGGQKLPVPKGVDPMRARPDRKAMRGR